MLRKIVKDYHLRTAEAGVSGFDSIPIFVELMRESRIYPDITTITDGVNEPECVVGGEKYLLFCANNYLSLTGNERVKRGAKNAIDKYGVGPGGSRVISGDIGIIRDLEARIAHLTGTEACLTLPTGYMANVAILKAVLDPFFFGMPVKKDSGAVFMDEHNHGSIQDGCELTTALKVPYRHDDLEDLERKLAECDRPNKLVVTEGVFSLEGEILDLPAYIELAHRYGAKIMIDDAHGVGILGPHGGGTADLYGCAGEVDILMGCMDKAFGGTGGFLCGSQALVDYLLPALRSSILSSALPTMMAGAMLESADIIEHGQELRRILFAKAAYLRDGLRDMGLTVLGRDALPSIPLYMGDEGRGTQFMDKLEERHILCTMVRWPAVNNGQARFRIIVMANHTYEQLDRFLDACRDIGGELGMLGERVDVSLA